MTSATENRVRARLTAQPLYPIITLLISSSNNANFQQYLRPLAQGTSGKLGILASETLLSLSVLRGVEVYAKTVNVKVE